MSTTTYLVVGIVSILSVLAWIGVLIWAAIGDGREQRHLHSVPDATPVRPDRIRLNGHEISDVNARLLINALITDGSPQALDLAERISAALTTHKDEEPLTPAERDMLLHRMPQPITRGLVELRDDLACERQQ